MTLSTLPFGGNKMVAYKEIIEMLEYFSNIRKEEGKFGNEKGYLNAISQIKYFEQSGIDIERFLSILESEISVRSIPYQGKIRSLIINLSRGLPIEEYDKKLISDYKTDNPHKHYMMRGQALRLVSPILRILKQENLEFEIVGSYRRECKVVGDIDIMIMTETLEEINQKLKSLTDLTWSAEGLNKDKLIIGDNLLEVDIRACEPRYKGAMLFHFTGSAKTNEIFRSIYKKRGMKLNEYGVTYFANQITSYYPQKILNQLEDNSEVFLPINKEETVFKLIGFQYLEPKDR